MPCTELHRKLALTFSDFAIPASHFAAMFTTYNMRLFVYSCLLIHSFTPWNVLMFPFFNINVMASCIVTIIMLRNHVRIPNANKNTTLAHSLAKCCGKLSQTLEQNRWLNSFPHEGSWNESNHLESKLFIRWLFLMKMVGYNKANSFRKYSAKYGMLQLRC